MHIIECISRMCYMHIMEQVMKINEVLILVMSDPWKHGETSQTQHIYDMKTLLKMSKIDKTVGTEQG